MIAGLVLAAGAATRMARPKIGLDVGGRPMVVRAVDAAMHGGLTGVVVVVPVIPAVTGMGGARDEWESARSALHALERPGVLLVENPDAAAGQSTSLRAGLGAMPEGTVAAVVLLGDQPLIRPDAVRSVVGTFQRTRSPVVQAAYGGRPAHPTLLATECWETLFALTGDLGAREVIAAHPEWRSLVEVGGTPPIDIDTAADYERLLRDHPFPTV